MTPIDITPQSLSDIVHSNSSALSLMKLLLFFYQCKLQLWVENPRQQMTLEHAMSQMDPQNSKFFPLYILLMSFFLHFYDSFSICLKV